MAFLLKSTKYVYTAIRFTGSRDFSTKRRILLLECPRVVNLNALSARTAASASAEVKVYRNEGDKVENLIFHLNRDMKYKNIVTKDIEDVIKAVKEKGELKDAQLTLLLKCCSESAFMAANHERIALAENIWNTAENFGLPFDISHYNSLLNVFLNNEHKFSVEEFFDILKNKNIEPNFMTYRLALKAYCQGGDIEGASRVLATLKDMNYVLKEDDFSSLIQGHCEIGDFEKANELISVMQNKDLTPTSNSYVKLLIGYAKHGKIEELNKLLDKLLSDKIVIRNYDLLEVIYALSLNNHESHIDVLIKRLNPDGDKGLKTATIIQKLLHNRKDSLALKVFEKTTPPGPQDEIVVSRAKFIIKHFVLYRSPNEVIEICKQTDSKGWSNSALSYALREVLLHKEDIVCLKFLNAMKKEGFEVRNHYYWPIIIKASKRGHFWMKDILQRLPKSAFMNSYETTHRVIFPHFSFKTHFDYEFLCGLGINRRLLSYCFFEKHLIQNDLEKAEYLIVRQQVTTKRWKHAINCLLSAFTKEQHNIQNFLTILHAFAHDYYYVRTFLQSHNEDDVEEQEYTEKLQNIFDYAIVSLIRRVKNEELFTKILEGMLERKMGISSTAANTIASSFQSEKIRDLTTKLASPEVRFQFDRDLLANKMWKISSQVLSSVSDSAMDLALNPSTKASSLAETVTSETPVTDGMFFAVLLGHKGLPKEAFKIFEILASLKEESIPQSAKELFKCFLYKQSSNSSKVVFDAIELGAKMGIPERDLNKMLKSIQEGINFGDALSLYFERASRHRKINGCLMLMIRAARERNYGAITKIKNASSEIVTAELLLTYHVIALATAGQVEMAKQLLVRHNGRLKPRILYTHCEMNYAQTSAEVFENYLELVRSLGYFDRAPLYKQLLRKYAESKDLDKALALCTVIQEDETPDYGVLKEISAFKVNPTLKNLEELANNLQTDFVIPQDDSGVSEPEIHEAANKATDPVDGAIKAASLGNVFTVLRILKEYPMKDVKSICTAFLENEKIKEFFQFIKQLSGKEKFSSLSNCFNINALLPFLEDDSNFEQYKVLALKCLEEGFITTPLISLFVTCVKMPRRLSVAEALVEQYSAHFQNIPFLEICEEAKIGGREIDFYENFVTSKNLKATFPEYHHVMFNRLIKHNCMNEDLTKALRYLEMAISNSAEKFIDKDVIHLLDQKLRKTGQSFPHPELLPTSSASSSF